MKSTLFVVLLLVMSSVALGADGLIAVKSPHPPQETLNRLEMFAKQKGMTIFARIDHAAGAAKVGEKLRPTEVLIFGNPKGGTPFMACAQTIGIDLPMKALAWEDAAGQVWLGYNDPAFVARRHEAAQCPVIETLKNVLTGLVQEAVAP